MLTFLCVRWVSFPLRANHFGVFWQANEACFFYFAYLDFNNYGLTTF
jgi:hypothetical protein